MATYDPGAVRTAIKTLLETLTGSGQPLAYVYDYLNPKIQGYPSVIFDMDSEEGSMLDEISNMRVLSWKLWIVAEIPVEGQQGAIDILDNAVKQVINLLEDTDNATLSGTVDWTMPVIGSRQQVASPEGNLMYQELNLKCHLASSIV